VTQETGPPNPRQTKSKEVKTPRSDQQTKNLAQNLSSLLRTIIPKMSCKTHFLNKTRIKECKDRLIRFLNKNKVQANQMIIVFAYIFTLFENFTPDQHKDLQKELNEYLDKRIEESKQFEEQDRLLF
jgi:hypothetical protein